MSRMQTFYDCLFTATTAGTEHWRELLSITHLMPEKLRVIRHFSTWVQWAEEEK